MKVTLHEQKQILNEQEFVNRYLQPATENDINAVEFEGSENLSLYTWDDNGNIFIDDRRKASFDEFIGIQQEAQNQSRAELEDSPVFKKQQLKKTLAALSEDFVQFSIGIDRPDINERCQLFLEAINELRTLEGKEPREMRAY